MAEVVLPGKKYILGVGVHSLTLEETVAVIKSWIRARYVWEEVNCLTLTRQVVTLNAEMLYRAWHDGALRDVINQADLVTPDGYGVIWAARRLGCRLPEQVSGIDLVHALAECAGRERWRIYFLGAAPGVAEAAAESLRRKYPGFQIAGTDHGYFSGDEIIPVIRKIQAARPDLLLVALGAPKQEFFIRVHRQELGVLVAIGVGGGFDVLAGRLRRAPGIFRRLHLEWLYRLLQEPSRWRRILVLPRFVWTVLQTPRPGGRDQGNGPP